MKTAHAETPVLSPLPPLPPELLEQYVARVDTATLFLLSQTSLAMNSMARARPDWPAVPSLVQETASFDAGYYGHATALDYMNAPNFHSYLYGALCGRQVDVLRRDVTHAPKQNAQLIIRGNTISLTDDVIVDMLYRVGKFGDLALMKHFETFIFRLSRARIAMLRLGVMASANPLLLSQFGFIDTGAPVSYPNMTLAAFVGHMARYGVYSGKTYPIRYLEFGYLSTRVVTHHKRLEALFPPGSQCGTTLPMHVRHAALRSDDFKASLAVLDRLSPPTRDIFPVPSHESLRASVNTYQYVFENHRSPNERDLTFEQFLRKRVLYALDNIGTRITKGANPELLIFILRTDCRCPLLWTSVFELIEATLYLYLKKSLIKYHPRKRVALEDKLWNAFYAHVGHYQCHAPPAVAQHILTRQCIGAYPFLRYYTTHGISDYAFIVRQFEYEIFKFYGQALREHQPWHVPAQRALLTEAFDKGVLPKSHYALDVVVTLADGIDDMNDWLHQWVQAGIVFPMIRSSGEGSALFKQVAQSHPMINNVMEHLWSLLWGQDVFNVKLWSAVLLKCMPHIEWARGKFPSHYLTINEFLLHVAEDEDASRETKIDLIRCLISMRPPEEIDTALDQLNPSNFPKAISPYNTIFAEIYELLGGTFHSSFVRNLFESHSVHKEDAAATANLIRFVMKRTGETEEQILLFGVNQLLNNPNRSNECLKLFIVGMPLEPVLLLLLNSIVPPASKEIGDDDVD
jgi:hypothetical protein